MKVSHQIRLPTLDLPWSDSDEDVGDAIDRVIGEEVWRQRKRDLLKQEQAKTQLGSQNTTQGRPFDDSSEPRRQASPGTLARKPMMPLVGLISRGERRSQLNSAELERRLRRRRVIKREIARLGVRATAETERGWCGPGYSCYC